MRSYSLFLLAALGAIASLWVVGVVYEYKRALKFEVKLVFVGCASEPDVPKFCHPYQDTILLIF